MEKIKVLHVVTRLQAGGSAANVVATARGLGRQFESALLCGVTSDTAGLGREVRADGARLIEAPHLRRSINPVADALAFCELLSALRKEKPDIVHTHTSKAGLLGRWAAFVHNLGSRRPCAIAHTSHGHVFYGYFGPWRTWLFRMIERWTGRITGRLIALSQGELRESLAAGVGSPEQWTVIPSGVSLPSEAELARIMAAGRDIRRTLDLAEDGLAIGTVARLEPVKGVEYFVRAVPALAAEFARARFIIVGDGSERPRLARLAEELGAADRIVFAGHQDDALAWMSALDVFVQPSLNEGLGRTLIEAGFLRIPAVASAVCGIPDVVLDGRTGTLVPPRDAARLAQAVRRLAGDRRLRQEFGAAAKAHVLSPDENGLPRFSEAAMLRKLEQLYLSLAEATRHENQ